MANKSLKIVDTAIKAAKGSYGASMYRGGSDNGGYRSNVGEWWNNKWHSDCLGFVHIMINGFTGNKNLLGGGAKMDDFVNNSTEEATLNNYCKKKGKFPVTTLKKCTLLEMHARVGHVGLYIGDYGSYNYTECTDGGWQFGWVDLKTGYTYNKKGGSKKHSVPFENWGEFVASRVDYSDQNAAPTPTDYETVNDVVKAIDAGKFGYGYEERSYKLWRYFQDKVNALYK